MSLNEDLGILASFLDDLKLVLETFVNDYIEVGIGKEFNNVGLIPIFKNSFPAAKRAIAIGINRISEPDEELLKKLDDHGLRGQSLLLKIEIINVYKKPLLDEIKAVTTKEQKKSKWLSRLKNGFLGFFKAADIPLESLKDCIPGLGLTLEFKKAIEHVIEK